MNQREIAFIFLAFYFYPLTWLQLLNDPQRVILLSCITRIRALLKGQILMLKMLQSYKYGGAFWTKMQSNRPLHSIGSYFHSIGSYLSSIRSYFHSIRSYLSSIRSYFHSIGSYLSSIRSYLHSIRSYLSSIRSYFHSIGSCLSSIRSYFNYFVACYITLVYSSVVFHI